MSFLAPLFLLGAAVIALPFWLHRLQTESSDRQPFSSAMLLEKTRERVHVQKKLKYLLLLSLRVLLLLLIALAFARPLILREPDSAGAAGDGTHLVLVDTSASMQADGVFERAVQQAAAAIDDAPDGAALQLLAADGTLHQSTPLTRERSALHASLRGLAPSALRLDFGRAMDAVARLTGGLPAPVTLHVVSDFQDSGMPARFADLVAPGVAGLVLHDAGGTPAGNWTIDVVRRTAGGIEALISGPAGEERTVTVELRLNGEPAGTQNQSIDGSGTFRFDAPTLEDGDNRLAVTIDTDDAIALDNTRYLVLENVPPEPIPILTADPRGLPVTYLAAALQSDPAGAYRVEPAAVGEFDPRTLVRYRWIVVDDAGALDEPLAGALARYVEGGGAILMFAGLRSAALPALPLVGNAVSPASLRRAGGEFLSIAQVDTAHPLLSRTEGWYGVNFSQTLPVTAQPDDLVLMRLENGEPFMLERRMGGGRILLLTGGLENQWNDLPLRPVFAGFAVEAARYLSGGDSVSRSETAGTVLALPSSGGASGQVIDPEGNSVLSLADTTRAQQVLLDQPGFYEVYTTGGSHLVAVNPDRREADLRPADGETLTRWRDSVGGTAGEAVIAATEPEPGRLELWHALLLALAVVLIGESVLGNLYLSPATAGRGETR